MVVCYNTYTITFQQKDCKNFNQLLQTASKMLSQPLDMLQVFYIASNSSQTHIESDSDLLSLRYLVKKAQLNFKIISKKTKEQIEVELIQHQVSNFLSMTYEKIAEQQIQRQINSELDCYFKQLYQKIIVKQAKQKLRKIEEEQVSRYMNNLRSDINHRMIVKRRASIDNKVKPVKASPENELFKRKQGKIQIMVKRILESMMPVMVKELSYRIIQELKDSSSLETAHTLQEIEDQSLEYL